MKFVRIFSEGVSVTTQLQQRKAYHVQ